MAVTRRRGGANCAITIRPTRRLTMEATMIG
jgi:hypothetical protein